ncbi:MAG: hypothetical protein Q9184_004743 [Pyrenodesmia sp. 2 TL-2023]
MNVPSLGPQSSTGLSDQGPFPKALQGLLRHLQSALRTTNTLDMLNVKAKSILGDDGLVSSLQQRILDGVPSQLRAVLQSQTCSPMDLERCEQVTKDTRGVSGIYLRLYQLADGTYYIYIGQSKDVWTRTLSHTYDIGAARKDPMKAGRHYRVAMEAVKTTVVILTKVPEGVLDWSEELMMLLFGSYFDHVVDEPQTDQPLHVGHWAADSWSAYMLWKIAAVSHQRTGWVRVSKKLQAKGCNVGSPVTIGSIDRPIFARVFSRDRTWVEIRRPAVRLTRTPNRGKLMFATMGFTFGLPPNISPHLHRDTMVYVAFELRLDGPHPVPWCRLPLQGKYSDWRELSGLAIRIEWETPQGWRATHLQRAQTTSPGPPGIGTLCEAYVTGSAVLAALKRQVWTNPSPWRRTAPSVRMLDIDYDHLAQTINITELTEITRSQQPTERDPRLVRQELEQMGFHVMRPQLRNFGGNINVPICDTCLSMQPPKPCCFSVQDSESCDICTHEGRPCTFTDQRDFLNYPISLEVTYFPLLSPSTRIIFPVDAPKWFTTTDILPSNPILL